MADPTADIIARLTGQAGGLDPAITEQRSQGREALLAAMSPQRNGLGTELAKSLAVLLPALLTHGKIERAGAASGGLLAQKQFQTQDEDEAKRRQVLGLYLGKLANEQADTLLKQKLGYQDKALDVEAKKAQSEVDFGEQKQLKGIEFANQKTLKGIPQAVAREPLEPISEGDRALIEAFTKKTLPPGATYKGTKAANELLGTDLRGQGIQLEKEGLDLRKEAEDRRRSKFDFDVGEREAAPIQVSPTEKITFKVDPKSPPMSANVKLFQNRQMTTQNILISLDKVEGALKKGGSLDAAGEDFVEMRGYLSDLARYQRDRSEAGKNYTESEQKLFGQVLPQILANPQVSISKAFNEAGLGRDPKAAIGQIRESVKNELISAATSYKLNPKIESASEGGNTEEDDLIKSFLGGN